MKKLAFLVVSAIFAGMNAFASVGERVVSNTASDESRIQEQMQQQLILEQPSDDANMLTWHESHYSHSSHRSHYSHRSHSSHYSSYWS